MRRMLLLVVFLMVLVGCSEGTSTSVESITSEKGVLSDYQKALVSAKDQNRTVFMIIETKNCQWCKRLKETTLQDPKVSKRLKNEFVVVTLNRDSSRYPKKFEAPGVPTVYMIDSNEEIYTKVVGYRKDPKDYLKWFDYIAIERGE